MTPKAGPTVPFELGRQHRRAWRHYHCDLCTARLEGDRTVAATIDQDVLDAASAGSDSPMRPAWIVHYRCYIAGFRHALLHVPELVALARTEDRAHEAYRGALTNRFTAGLRRLQVPDTPGAGGLA